MMTKKIKEFFSEKQPVSKKKKVSPKRKRSPRATLEEKINVLLASNLRLEKELQTLIFQVQMLRPQTNLSPS